VEECVGFLTQVSRWDENNGWQVIENEPHALEWSYGDAKSTTLYAGADPRLKIYCVSDAAPNAIRSYIKLYPSRLEPGFTNTFGIGKPICAYSFWVLLKARDCKPVEIDVSVQSSPDALTASVSLDPQFVPESIKGSVQLELLSAN